MIKKITAALVATILLLSLSSQANAVDPVFTVYMSTSGLDSNDGLTPSTAVKTLERVEAVLNANDPTTDVEVKIDQGTYVAGKTSWQFYVPGHSIAFMPDDYEYGDGIGGIAGLPKFVNNGTGVNWFYATLPTGHTGGNTSLRFYYLRIEGYAESALTISGGYLTDPSTGMTVPKTIGANGNIFFGMVFSYIGTKHFSMPDRFGYGGLVLANSSNNSVKNNHFQYLENLSPYQGHIHGIYITTHSKNNFVNKNSFLWISGGPVRVRNDSNDNYISENTFTRTGLNSYYDEWFCDTQCVIDNAPHGRECASHGNDFRINNIVSAYDNGPISLWKMTPPGSTYAGNPPCTNEGQPRLETGTGNQ